MTRAERAAEQVRKAKAKFAEEEQRAKDARAEQRKAIMQAEATVREETRKATNKRRYHIGALADEAGLFVWSNADLQAVFAVLARLVDTPNPVGILEGLMCGDGVALTPTSDDLAPRSSYRRFLPSYRPEGETSDVPSPLVSGSVSR